MFAPPIRVNTLSVRRSAVRAITESAMRGELDFQQSFRRRVALLKGLPEATLQRVIDDMPVRVEYGLTEKGRALEPAVRSLKVWARSWL